MAVCSFASQTHRYDRLYPGTYVSGTSWKGLLHSTETTGLPSYKGGSVAPHFTIDPRAQHVWQHFDTARPARGLQHIGSVQTNNARAIQIEIVAYSDIHEAAQTGGLRIDQMTASELAYVAELMRWIESKHPIRRVAPATWKPYPASAGVSNGQRFTGSSWYSFTGWCGHSHVPQNNHGDPSDINIAALLAVAPPTPPKPKTGDKMQALCQSRTSPAEYVTDGIYRRWIPAPSYRDDLVAAGVPAKVWMFDTVAGLTAFAGPVAPGTTDYVPPVA